VPFADMKTKLTFFYRSEIKLNCFELPSYC
jgi:hypothetical protein